MSQEYITVSGATRVAVGLSTIIKYTPVAFDHAYSIKIIAGSLSGTLEFVNGATAGGSGWGTGYPLGANEVMNLGGPSAFYLAASGVTMVAAVLVGKTAGATIV